MSDNPPPPVSGFDALRAAAIAADPGPYTVDHDGDQAWVHDPTKNHVFVVYDRAGDDGGPYWDEACEANLRFHMLCTPQTILELLAMAGATHD